MAEIRTVLTDSRIAFVLLVSVPVGRAVTQNLIRRAEITVIVFIVNIFVFAEKAVFHFWTGIGAQQRDPILFELVGNGRCFVRRVSDPDFNIQLFARAFTCVESTNTTLSSTKPASMHAFRILRKICSNRSVS